MHSDRFPGMREALKKIFTNRSVYAAVLVVVLTAVLIGRLFHLQIVQGGRLNAQAGQTVSSSADLTVRARRGNIYDRNGVLLATTRRAYRVDMVNTDMAQSERDAMYLALIELFERNNDVYDDPFGRYITPELEWGSALAGDEKSTARSNWINTLVRGFRKSDRDSIHTARDAFLYLRNTVFKLDERYTDEEAYKIMLIRYRTHVYGLSYLTPTTIATDVCQESMEYLEARYYEFPGIRTEEVYYRVYVNDAAASHVIGYVRAISEEEYAEMKDAGYSNDDLIGKIGIEKAAEAALRGQNGTRTVYRDDSGVLRTLSYTAPQPGADVYLTLDYALQQKCVRILQETIDNIVASADQVTNFGDANAGSAVVMNVRTGEVLAMANYPYYDNSIFIAPSTDLAAQNAIRDLFQDASSPSLNRATQGLYPVGSTFKPLVSVAALMSGSVSLTDTVNCQRTMQIGNRTHSCLGYHGNLTLRQAIAHSCNIYFYTVGIRTGIDTIDSWARTFGLGEKTGIEIGEYAGYRSNPETMKIREEDTSHVWSNSDTAQTSIGQLYTLFTPLQLCNYVSALANGGYLNTPHLIGSIVAADGTVTEDGSQKREARTELGVSSWVLDAVRDGMLQMVAQSGSAQAAFSAFPAGFVAAKTGTPQTGMEAFGQSSHSVLICYAPANDPEIAVSIVIEHGAAGGNSLAAAGKIFEAYFHTDTELGQRTFSGFGFGWQGLDLDQGLQ